MSPTSTLPPEVPKQFGLSKVRECCDQVATLIGLFERQAKASQQQAKQIRRLQKMMSQYVEAVESN